MGKPLRSDLGTYLIAPNYCITATQRKNKYELRSPPVHSFCPTRSAGTSYVDEWERNLRGNKTGWPAKSQGWQCKSLCQGASRLAAKLSKPLTLQYKKEHGAIFKLSSPLLHTPYLDDLFATFQSPSHHLKRSGNTLLVIPAALL
jgi:hypothetical protein